jgi:cytochrome c-type biogenesis protein CcmF
LDEDLQVIEVADAFLRHQRFGRDGAESTTKAYAHAIALFLRWCARTGRSWQGGVEQFGLFMTWLAHAGLGVVALGVVGATSWKSEAIQVLAPGQSMNVGSYALRLDATEQVQGPNYTADRAAITVMSNGRVITVVHPEKRSYPVEQMVTSQSSIRTTVISDLYVVLGDSREGGGWVVRAYVNPMAPFIWLGAVVMAFAGFIALGARLAAKLRAARIAAGTVAEPAE